MSRPLSEIATVLVLFVLYTNAAVVAVKFHGVPFIVGASVPLLLLVPIVRHVVFGGEDLIITRVVPLIVAFLVIQLVGVGLALRRDVAADRFSTSLIEGLVLYLLVTNAIRTPRMLQNAIWAVVLAGGLLGGVTFYQQLTKTYDNNYYGFAQVSDAAFDTGDATGSEEDMQPRLAGPIGEKNYYAQFMAVLVPFGMFLYWGARSVSMRALAMGCVLLTLIAIALTASRAAAVGLGAMVLVMIAMGYIGRRHVAVIVLGVVVIAVAVPSYAVRLASLGAVTSSLLPSTNEHGDERDGSMRGRSTEMWAAALVFAEHPLIGVGPGMYHYHYRTYAKRVGGHIHSGNRASHSMYLGLAAQFGSLGLGVFLLIVFFTLRDLALARARTVTSQPELANLVSGLMVGLIVYLTIAVFLDYAYVRYFWLVMALGGAGAHIVMSAQQRSGPETVLSSV